MVILGRVVDRVPADGLSDVALGGAVVLPLGPDLVQGDDEKEVPELLTGGDVVRPVDHAAEETAEDRLDDIVIIDATGQIGRGPRSC